LIAEKPRERELIFADEQESFDDFPLREGLTWRERKEAETLYSIARGVMLVTGQPGSGKDLFGVSLSAMNKYYFNRRILLDFAPYRAFGEYVLFDAQFMMREINKMAIASKVEKIAESNDEKEISDFVGESSKKWVENEGELLLKGSILYLSELKRYCYNRRPHNPFNKFIGSICSVWRHLDLLIIGTHVHRHEIDQYTYLAYVNHWAKCSWSLSRPHSTDVSVYRGAFIGANDVYNVESKEMIIHINGKWERPFLGQKEDVNGNKIYKTNKNGEILKDEEGKDIPEYYSFFELYPTKNMVNLKPVIRKDM